MRPLHFPLSFTFFARFVPICLILFTCDFAIALLTFPQLRPGVLRLKSREILVLFVELGFLHWLLPLCPVPFYSVPVASASIPALFRFRLTWQFPTAVLLL